MAGGMIYDKATEQSAQKAPIEVLSFLKIYTHQW